MPQKGLFAGIGGNRSWGDSTIPVSTCFAPAVTLRPNLSTFLTILGHSRTSFSKFATIRERITFDYSERHTARPCEAKGRASETHRFCEANGRDPRRHPPIADYFVTKSKHFLMAQSQKGGGCDLSLTPDTKRVWNSKKKPNESGKSPTPPQNRAKQNVF